MKKSLAIMIRSVCSFIAASWLLVIMVYFIYNGSYTAAIYCGAIAVFAAFVTAVEYKYAEETYKNEQEQLGRSADEFE